MDIVHAPELNYISSPFSHRSPGLAFKTLFEGSDSDAANNYKVALVSSRSFESPVHKHNFDQLRFAWKGDFNIGPHRTIREGELCYHPEGVSYGPQKDDVNERILLLFQFGGASGQGYMSSAKQRAANVELEKIGTFKDGHWRSHAGGPLVDGFQAIWEFANGGEKLVYPEGRYKAPILISPQNFEWKEVQKSEIKPTDAWVKALGTFSQRGTTVQQFRLAPQGDLVIKAVDGVQFLVIKEGKAEIGADTVATESVVRLRPGAGATISSDVGVEFVHIVIPTFA